MKNVKMFLGVLVAAALFASCSKTGKSENVLEFYHAYHHSESEWPVAKVMRDIFDDFAALHANDEVTFKAYAVTNADEIAAAQITGGNFPDVVYMNGGVPLSAISQGLVLDLKPYIDENNLVHAVGINYTQNNYNGAIYTVHDQIETRGVWLNSAILRKAGVAISDLSTWDGFERSMEKVRMLNDGSYGYIAGQGSRFMFNAMLASSASGRALLEKPLSDDAINSAEFKDAFLRTARLDKANGSTHSKKDIGESMDDFNKKGIVAVLHNGVWNAGALDASVVSSTMPSLFPNNVGLLTAGGGITISANLSDAKKALALEFLKYMVSTEVQEKIFLKAQANPCNTMIDLNRLVSQSTDNVALKLANAIMQVNRAQTVVIELSHVWGQDVASAITNALMECSVSNSNIEAIFAKLQENLKALIS